MHDHPLNNDFPETLHFSTKEEFDDAVGKDFIQHANKTTGRGERFLVGLSHGQSPSGPYQHILDHYDELNHPDLIRYTFVHSRVKRQRGLQGILDAREFLRELQRKEIITDEHILGTTLKRDSIEAYGEDMEEKLGAYLQEHGKTGLDYVFLASDPTGRVGSITRNSSSFGVQKLGMVVHEREEKELTMTPWFLQKTHRIAFLATKSEKRRSLAYLYDRWGKPDECPSFLRYMPEVSTRMTVFIDDRALTWPQLALTRKTEYGPSRIRIDLANPIDESRQAKLPVILLIHGFLGLNSFDGLLTSISSAKYIAAAMHYGSIPHDLPPPDYSKHVVKNIDFVVDYFGKLGHPVYIFDHSMANIYYLMINQDFENLPGIKNYLRGRIGANPFFGEEAKHAAIGFLDNVLLPSKQSFLEKSMFVTARGIIPWDFRKNVRWWGIQLTEWLINRELDNVWIPIKKRIFKLMSELGSLPHLNRVPVARALNRLPAKIFGIQVHSALLESIAFDSQVGLKPNPSRVVPLMILKSDMDPVAKFLPRLYKGSGAKIVDITNPDEKDHFREHLYHMIHPKTTTRLIDEFIVEVEKGYIKKKKPSKPAVHV